MQLVDFSLQSLLLRQLVAEQAGQPRQSGRSPSVELVRVDAVFSGKLVDGLLLTEHIVDDLGLKVGGVFLLHG